MKHSLLRRALSFATCAALAVTSFVFTTSAAPSAGDSSPSFVQQMDAAFQNLELDYRPEARWWLAEGSHTDETLLESIHELYDSGFGAVEFVTLDESRYLDDATYAWGSEEWIHDSHLILRECTKLGMGVSFTGGTNWATANLTVISPDEEAAAQELGYKTVELSAGETFDGILPTPQLTSDATKLKFVKVIGAKRAETGSNELVEASLADLSAQVTDNGDGTWSLRYTAPDDGDYILFGFWQYGTSERYKPAATGKSYTINYFSREGADALINYWDGHVLDDEMKQLILENGDVSLYMDSLELNPRGADSTKNLWCSDFLEEFETRSGYDASLYLPILIATNAGGLNNHPSYYYSLQGEEELCKKIRNDLYQVNTELYQEECLDVLTEWLHANGMTLRAENSYGKLLEISQPMKNIDYVETESLEFGGEIDAYRGMAGGAHVYDKLMSSETGALLAANYTRSSFYWRNLFYTQFAAGIQRTITHGYASEYGPVDNIQWPGYEGMGVVFAERFNKRQPNALDYPEQMGGHITRLQKVLREGEVQMDLGILRTDYNFNNGIWTMDLAQTRFHRQEGFYWTDMTLQNAGYTYDYFSPYLLEDITCENALVQPDGPSYQALILYQEELPYQSAQILLQWAKDGLPVVIVEGPTTESVMGTSLTKTNRSAAITTGSNDGLDDELAELVAQLKALDNVACVETEAEAYDALQSLGVQPRAEYVEPNQTLLPMMRKADNATYLYLYNYMYENGGRYVGQVSVEGVFKPYVLNTWTGETEELMEYSCENGRTILNVDLAAGDVMVFALDPNDQAASVVSKNNVDKAVVENGAVTLYVPESGDASVACSDGSIYEAADVSVPDSVMLDGWNLTVESWEPGEKVYRTEDRGLGYTTTEATYTTNKRQINVGITELVPWKELEQVGGEVSGVGYYTNSFTLPEDWDTQKNALVFDAESLNGGTAALWVNGVKASINMNNGEADISDYVQPGENTIEVRVTSSLKNQMIVQKYSGWFGPQSPDAYGMTGETTLTAYTKVTVSEPEIPAAVKSAAAPESAQVGSDFVVTVVTAASVTDVRLYNEYDLAIGVKAVDAAENGDATKTWSLTVSAGTVGNRTFKVVTRGPESYYRDSGVTVSLEITSVPPVLNSFDLPESAVANRTFIVKATTDMAATKINIYNEFGTKMSVKSLSYKVVDGQKVWTGVMAIGTKGERTFTAYAVNRYGVRSSGQKDMISVKPFA